MAACCCSSRAAVPELPNHLATAHIVAHPDLYPQLAFNGLFKSNALFTLWLHVFGSHGLFGAARVFVAIVLAVNALALPLFVLRFAGRRAVLVAACFVWPLVHSFSVAMGFLNFAFALVSLSALSFLDRQRGRPTLARIRHRRPGGAALVRTRSAGGRGRARRPARRQPLDLAGANDGRHRAAVAARPGGGAVCRGGAAARGQGAAHQRRRRRLLLSQPWGAGRPPLDRRLGRAHAMGKPDHRSRHPVAAVRLEATPDGSAAFLSMPAMAVLALPTSLAL